MKEHSFVIVRTKRDNVVECFAFMTPGYNCGNVMPKFVNPERVADEINIHPYLGGMLTVELKQYYSNGKEDYPVTEKIYFEKELVTAVEIYTEFDSCRTKDPEVRNEDCPKDNYPCSDHDCYDKGNYHAGCESCAKFLG